MGIVELLLISVGLAMDAFAVAICKGLSMRKATFKNAVTVGLYFGMFQAGMPLLGYFLGVRFAEKIAQYDHWIAFVLLVLLGLKMLKESQSKHDETEGDASLSFRVMSVLAIATSIDALAVGISFAFLQIDNIAQAVTIIGVVSFLLSMLGVKIGNVFGKKYKAGSEVAGGIILIGIGIKILIEGFLS